MTALLRCLRDRYRKLDLDRPADGKYVVSTMQITWLDIVDSAVKIGLGVVLGGGFGYLNAKLGHERDAKARYATRRRDQLEKVRALLTEFDKKRIHQTACIRSYLEWKDNDDVKAKEQLVHLEKIDEEFPVTFENFTEASRILLTLDATDADEALWDYYTINNKWYEITIQEFEIMAKKGIDELREKIRLSRRQLLSLLAAAYRSE